MGRKTDAYVDTSALIAFADRSDTYHALFKRLFSNPPRLVTTTLVVAEGHGWFLKRYDRTRALQFIALVEALSPMVVVAVGQEEQAGGIRLLRKFSDQDLTMTDAVGLHVMTASRIHTCWSTDRHLGLTGASLVTEGTM
jgi:predicted nucleic acid-binding protein